MKFTAYTAAAALLATAGALSLDPRTGDYTAMAVDARSVNARVQVSTPTADDLVGFYIRNASIFIGAEGERTGAKIVAGRDEAGLWFIDSVAGV